MFQCPTVSYKLRSLQQKHNALHCFGRFVHKPVYIVSSDVTVICGHNTISMLSGNTAYCVKLSGENLLHYSNKTESVGLRIYPYYHCLTKNVMPR